MTVKKHELIKLVLKVRKGLKIWWRDIAHIRWRDLSQPRIQSVSIHHGLRKGAPGNGQGCGSASHFSATVVFW